MDIRTRVRIGVKKNEVGECDLCRRYHTPNAETIAAMEAAERGEVEAWYGSTEELFDRILKEE